MHCFKTMSVSVFVSVFVCMIESIYYKSKLVRNNVPM